MVALSSLCCIGLPCLRLYLPFVPLTFIAQVRARPEQHLLDLRLPVFFSVPRPLAVAVSNVDAGRSDAPTQLHRLLPAPCPSRALPCFAPHLPFVSAAVRPPFSFDGWRPVRLTAYFLPRPYTQPRLLFRQGTCFFAGWLCSSLLFPGRLWSS